MKSFFMNKGKYRVQVSLPEHRGTVTLDIGQVVEGQFFSRYGYLTPVSESDFKWNTKVVFSESDTDQTAQMNIKTVLEMEKSKKEAQPEAPVAVPAPKKAEPVPEPSPEPEMAPEPTEEAEDDLGDDFTLDFDTEEVSEESTEEEKPKSKRRKKSKKG